MITPETLIITIVLVILSLVIPRKYLLVPFLVTACFIPSDQRIIIIDLDFTPLRMLVVAGVARLWLRCEVRSIKWNRFDRILLAWVICGAVIYIVQWADARTLIYKCGVLFDVLGLYWLFRQSIRSWEDIRFTFMVLAFCSIILLPFVVFEWATGQNPFSILGRVHTVVRGVRYRCQASFPHSIIMGLFWATLVPVFISLTKASSRKYLYWAATTASVLMVATTFSSTPILTLVIVLLLLLLFPVRHYGKEITLAFLGSIFALHLVMKAPVWHLIMRVAIISGSTGYHRYKLIDKAIEHFQEWAFLGARSTAHWGYGLQDVTNQYVLEGIQGGLVTLVLFTVLVTFAVKAVGSYSLRRISVRQQWLSWGICILILGHCISFFGVSYFGQIRMLLYLTFAMVGVIYEMSMDEQQRSNAQAPVYAHRI